LIVVVLPDPLGPSRPSTWPRKDGTRDTGPAVEVGSLIKRYGELVAVDGLSLKIPGGGGGQKCLPS